MLRSGAPTQLTQVFAGGSGAGPTNVVPLTPTGSQPAGQIAYSTGFTSTNMTPIASGGVAPWGADMNGLLKAQTQAQIYQQAGFLYPYSNAFSTAMSGYPAGAVLPMASGLGLWLNQTDGNTTDPDSSGASGWVPQPANQGVTALTGLTGGTVVLTPNQLGTPFITLAGTLMSNLQVTLPLSAGRTYTIQNNTTGAYTVTVAGATGTGVTIAQGTANGTTVYTDGTNWYTGQFNGAGVYLPINGTAVAATKLATARTIAMTGDVSWTSPAFDGTANVTAAGTITAGAVTLAKMANFQANSLMGNPAGSAAAPSAITLQNGLVFSGTNLSLGNITPSSVTTGAITGTTGTYSGTVSAALVNATGATATTYTAMQMSNPGGVQVQVAASGNTAGLVQTTNAYPINISTNSTLVATFGLNGITSLFSAFDLATHGVNAANLILQPPSGSTYGGNVTLNHVNGDQWNVFPSAGLFNIGYATGGGGPSPKLTLSTAGNLTVTGTINFATSDATLKELGAPVEPTPFHRVPFYAYTRRDTGECGWGPTAQDVAAIKPEYTRLQGMIIDGHDRDVLILAKEQITMDTAFWAGRQVDLLWQEIADLRRQLADARTH